MGKNWLSLTILDKSDRTRKEMVCRSAMKRCSRLRAIMVSTLLRMTNQFAFRKTERPWQMMASLCRFMCHSSSLWKTEQKSVRPPPMEKSREKSGKSTWLRRHKIYTVLSYLNSVVSHLSFLFSRTFAFREKMGEIIDFLKDVFHYALMHIFT